MDAQILNEKLELIQWLSSIEDKSIIKKLIELRKEKLKIGGTKFQMPKKHLLKKD